MTHQKTQFDKRGGADNLIYGEFKPEYEIPLVATYGGHLLIAVLNDKFNAMIKELRRISFQMSLITGVSLDESDIEGG